MSLPADFQHAQTFLTRLGQIYAEPYVEAIVQSLAGDQWHAFWVNPLAATLPSDFVPPGQPVRDMPGMWQVAVTEQLTRSEAASAGWIYIQNVSSYLLPVALVHSLTRKYWTWRLRQAEKPSYWQQLCTIVAVWPRWNLLKPDFIACAPTYSVAGVTNTVLYQRDGRGVGRAVPQRFDRVLLDAPCSSESHMRWHIPGSYQHWSPRKVKECQRKQKSLLRSAYAALKPGGEMLYCTCSFSPEENELVVEHLLKRSDAEIVPLAAPDQSADAPGALDYFLPGLQEWAGKALSAELRGTLRILPHGAWDGFYLARLRRPV